MYRNVSRLSGVSVSSTGRLLTRLSRAFRFLLLLLTFGLFSLFFAVAIWCSNWRRILLVCLILHYYYYYYYYILRRRSELNFCSGDEPRQCESTKSRELNRTRNHSGNSTRLLVFRVVLCK
jgi:hypothetical protein